MKTAFVTDSGTGKTIEDLAAKGIFSVPLQISYDNRNRNDLENITLSEVFDLIRQEKILATSLPSLGRITELFEQLKADGYEPVSYTHLDVYKRQGIDDENPDGFYYE